jgi:4-hydroxy-tetrahydrodipicolinate reductase
MKVAVIGNGRMGNEIAPILRERGHEVLGPFGRDFSAEALTQADVAIEFSLPEAAVDNLKTCLNNKVPVVCGTTGWLKHLSEIEALAKEQETGFLYASNFSLGVNLFFALNQQLAKLMQPFEQYTPSLEEIHHTKKLDAPSGTALTLAQAVLDARDTLSSWQLKAVESEEEALHESEVPSRESVLDITAKRIEDVPGTHSISYSSAVDDITITHTAFNRKGFALGAVLAAEFMAGKKGIHTMKDVLNLN